MSISHKSIYRYIYTSIQQKLNNRPRKTIAYNTPNEILNSELKVVA